METLLILSAAIAMIFWISVLFVPWSPWLIRQVLEDLPGIHDRRPVQEERTNDLSDVTVVIPARNEATVIAGTLTSLAGQGHGLKIILVDDCSTDKTAEIAQGVKGIDLKIIKGKELPEGWAGKLWALQQGILHVTTKYSLLIDADIQLALGVISDLRTASCTLPRPFVSIMAVLPMKGFWEKLLTPAFIYFFRSLYPFHLANSADPRFAAAAGGCIFLETQLLKAIGGFESFHGALIDDCTFAAEVKKAGFRIWIGHSRRVISARGYSGLGDIWNMVARSAFTQLRYSFALLMVTTVTMLVVFIGPVVYVLIPSLTLRIFGLVAWLAMAISYMPTLRFYRRNLLWSLLFPFIGILYLFMTWTSAIRFWRGTRSRWKEREYLR